MDVILEAGGLAYRYPGGVSALDGLSLTMVRGRRLAILGPNGAGKTTLLLHLNGTLRPEAGEVRLDGAVQGYGRSALARWRRRVGLVLQEPDDQLFAASVFEDVSFGPLNLGLPDAEARARVEEALAALRIADLAERPTHMLSFGQKKRAAIAGAVAMRPDVLLLDEPTAGLDQFGAVHLLAVLDKLRAGGATLAFTTHDVDLAWSWADEVALFVDGTVIRQGAPEEVLSDHDAMARARLKPPLLLELGLKARERGWLAADAPLPRNRAAALALMGG
ncbi:MAG: ATP-binding cassette domain-containing protein [Magnetospirillum sp.]|nr:ATP-binding cassette domain-containing protein [Magnetospirillum sp.]